MLNRIFIFLITGTIILALFPGNALALPKKPTINAIDFLIKKRETVKDLPTFNNPDTRVSVPRLETPEKDVNMLIEFDFFSKYVSKGLPCSKGPVWQPSAALEVYNLGVSVWANFVLNDEPNQGEFNEIDVLPYYNLNTGNLNFLPAVNFMFGVNSDPASLNYMSHNVIRPQFHISYALGHFVPYMDAFFYVYPSNRFGIYSDYGLLFHYEFNETVTLDTSVQLAVGGKRWNAPRIADVGTSFNNFEYMLSLTFNIAGGFTAAPVLHVVVTIPESLRRSLSEPDFVWGGLTLKYSM